MSVTLIKGEPLTNEHLNIYILKNNQYINPFSILYTIYKKQDQFYTNTCWCEEPLAETVDSTPIPFGIGKYFAPWQMPQDIEVGQYRIKWNFREFVDSPLQQAEEEFYIVAPCKFAAEATGTLPHQMYQGGETC